MDKQRRWWSLGQSCPRKEETAKDVIQKHNRRILRGEGSTVKKIRHGLCLPGTGPHFQLMIKYNHLGVLHALSPSTFCFY